MKPSIQSIARTAALHLGITALGILSLNCSGDDQQLQEGVEQGEQGEQGEEGNEYAEGDKGDDSYSDDATAQANALQSQQNPALGATVNNSTKDGYADDLTAATASPAIDEALPAVETAPAPEAPTFMPGSAPLGWARTQNGLFINVQDLSDKPLGYNEPPALWR